MKKQLINCCQCKFCGRSNKDTPNPWLPPELVEQSDKQFLQFRRERGKECTSCSALIRSKPREWYSDPDLHLTLAKDSIKNAFFLEDLERFEEKKRNEAASRSTRPVKRVEATHSTGFRMRMIMGYFWPVDVLRREKKDIPRSLTTIKYNGKSLKGSILDASHGTPIGVIEMENYDDKGATKVT